MTLAELVLDVFGAPEEVTVLFADGQTVGAPVFSTINIDVAFS